LYQKWLQIALKQGGVGEYVDHKVDTENGGLGAIVAEVLGYLMTDLNIKTYLDRSITFLQYINLIDRLVAEGKTTGPNQSEKMAEYTRLNRQRMHRLGKTIEIDPEVRAVVGRVNRPMIWLIITEAWCGDAAQNIPVIEKLAAENQGIETRYVLRDENLKLMDRFLTNGARAIPKLIALDVRTFEILGTWGSRPAAAQVLHRTRLAEGIEKAVVKEELQRWYNADKGVSLQQEFVALVNEWRCLPSARSATALLNLALF